MPRAWTAAARPSCLAEGPEGAHRHHRRPGARGVTPEHLPRLVAAGRQGLHQPDQPAAGQRGRLRAALPAGDVATARHAPPTTLAAHRRLGAHLLPRRGRCSTWAVSGPRRCTTSSSRSRTGCWRGGALPVMVPAVDADSIVKRGDLDLDDYADSLDGLVLQGGNDVAPESYGETPLHPDWAGDRVRDRYEMELIARLRRRRQAGVRHLPRPAVAQRDLRRHAAAGHRHAAAAVARRTATRPVRAPLPRQWSSCPARGWPRCTRA